MGRVTSKSNEVKSKMKHPSDMPMTRFEVLNSGDCDPRHLLPGILAFFLVHCKLPGLYVEMVWLESIEVYYKHILVTFIDNNTLHFSKI